jgi:large subunit ribosomal protein L15
MKLHDLRPAEGAHKAKTRVGRGIAAGKGKTAGRGTKGQKARAGGSIPPWFEGGQTPLHMRIPKLRGFKNRFKVEYEVVNVGAIEAAVERGAFEAEAPSGKAAKTSKASAGSAQITINADILRAVGLVRTPSKPLKILGAGELSASLFVVADAFTASARSKIEAAGGVVNVLEIPSAPKPALGVEVADTAKPRTRPAAEAASAKETTVAEAPAAEVDEAPAAEVAEDVPAAEAEVAEAPVAEAPAAEAPTAEAEVAEAPAAEAEVAEAPAAEAAVEEAPAKAARAKSPKPKAKAKPKAPAASDEPAPEAANVESDEAETTSGDDA